MNRVSTFTTSAKSQQSKAAEALLKSGKQLRHSDINSFKETWGNLSSTQTGFDLTQIPARPALHTNQQIQCCAKDGSGCSCPKCQEAAANENKDTGVEDEQQAAESQPEQSSEQISAVPESSEAQQNENESTQEQTSSTLVVEDSVTDLSGGQMRKTEFLQMLRSSICDAIGPVLATVGQTTDGCPYLNYWLDLYQEKDAAQIEATAKKYAPDVAGATTAKEYISIITQRALRAAEIWARTGKLNGVPEGVPTTIPGETPAQNNTEENPVQAKAKNGGVKRADDPHTIKKELGDGQPLSSDVRSRMESAFGTSLSNVRTHTDAAASGLSNKVNARAFAVGNHIAFGNGEYQPGTLLGDALIAHELAHTIQQNGAENSVDKLETGTSEYDTLEKDADIVSVNAIESLYGKTGNGSLKNMSSLRSGLRISRCSKGSSTTKTTPSAKTGSFTETMVPFKTGVSGTIEFMPDPKNCPVCTNIRLVQVVRVSEKPGQDYTWPGGEANREKVKTSEDTTKGILPNYFVDHQAAGCTAGGKCSIYYRDHWSNSSLSQDGSNDGTTAKKASLWDKPTGDADDVFEFETCARCATNSTYLRSFHWGFTADSSGNVTKSGTSEADAPSATFLAAAAKFDTFYGN